MGTIKFIIMLARNYKKYAPVIAAVSSGVGMVLAKNYDEGLRQIFEALLVVFSGASVMSLHAEMRHPERP